MREIRIVVEPFEFVSYLSIECMKELNEHGHIKIRGIIKTENVDSYLEYAARETWVTVRLISDEGWIRDYFTGILTDLTIEKEGEVHVLNLEVKTGSFLLDLKKHIRSFQTDGFLYAEMARICMKNEAAKCVIAEAEEVSADGLILQYRETDWEFMKRIASYAHVPLIALDDRPVKDCCLGYQSGVATEIQADDYQMTQNYGAFLERKEEGYVKIDDYVCYIVHSREVYDLGSCVLFAGKERIVGKIISKLRGQELCHEYHLVSREQGILKPFYNTDFAGVSVKAHVTAVEKTVVCVQIDEDENKGECGSRWFDYATVYSTPDGTGWYCMPEVGDEVRMVLPEDREAKAYVASSVHLGAAGGRTNPDVKFWKNKQKKEIRFTPDAIVLTNNAGNRIELSDSEGIRIVSNKDITLQADGEMKIKSSNAAVNMDAQSEILLRQGATMISMKDEINILGGKIYMN